MRDPYNNAQIRFERTDRTGRWIRIEEQQQENWLVGIFGGIAFGIIFAVMFFLAI